MELWSRPAMSAPELAQADGGLGPAEGLAALAGLPAGLVQAEAIHVLRVPPPLPPLRPGSDWYGLGGSLAVVRSPEALPSLLDGLQAYARVAAAVFGAPLDFEAAPERSWLELAARLQIELQSLQAAARAHPALQAELQMMASRRFEARLQLHPQVRPDWLRAEGERVADRLLSALGGRPAWLLISERRATLELLSPYCRDLAGPILQWARENPQRLALEGLYEAIAGAQGPPSWELAALVVPSLFAAAPQLLAERRAAEAAQAMSLEEVAGLTCGQVDLQRLTAPAPELGALAGLGLLLLGPLGPLQDAAARVLLAEGQLRRLGIVFVGAPGDHGFAPQAVFTEQEGFFLEAAPALQRALDQPELDPAMLLPDRHLVVGLLRGAARAAAMNGAPAVPAFVLREPQISSGLAAEREVFETGRGVIRVIADSGNSDKRHLLKTTSQECLPQLAHRYRALLGRVGYLLAA